MRFLHRLGLRSQAVYGFLHWTCSSNWSRSHGCSAFGDVKCCLLSCSVFVKWVLFVSFLWCTSLFFFHLFIYFVKVCKKLLMLVFHERLSCPGGLSFVEGLPFSPVTKMAHLPEHTKSWHLSSWEMDYLLELTPETYSFLPCLCLILGRCDW